MNPLASGKSHVPHAPEPDRPRDPPDQDLPGQDDDPVIAPLQERKERDAQRQLQHEGVRHEPAPPQVNR